MLPISNILRKRLELSNANDIILPRGYNMDEKDIGNVIKERRKSLGLTQAYLAALSNTGIRFIIELERGKPTVQLDKILDVLSVLNLKVEIKLNE